MKKHLILLAVCGLLCALPAFAAEENQPARYGPEPAEIVDVPVDESTYREETPAPYVPVKREAGRGEIEDIYQYWEENGYPEDVSYAFDAGGEVIDDTIYTWWEIGLVNADEARRQEILDLIAPTGLVVFYNCTYTHAQKMEAYEALSALNDESIQVIFTRNADFVVAAVPEEQEKEYAQFLVGTYGAVVSVVGGTIQTQDLTQAVPGMGLDGAGDASVGSGRWGPPDSERETGDVLLPNTPSSAHDHRPLYLAGALAAGALLLGWRARRAAAQTAAGPVATPARRQAEEAVRACGEEPRPQVYQRILERLEQEGNFRI